MIVGKQTNIWETFCQQQALHLIWQVSSLTVLGGKFNRKFVNVALFIVNFPCRTLTDSCVFI